MAEMDSPQRRELGDTKTSGQPEADATETVLTAGSRLGQYIMEAPLGAGGMGQVFRAHDPRLNRKVAIKVLNKRFRERSEREARAIAALNHPNICTIYEAGPDYLVMELIEGETLAARIGRGSVRTEDLVAYGSQIAGALAAAHAKGIIHRDLKPANIMLTKAGVKVLDFGLAKFLDQSGEQLTVPGMIMGTPAYMPPEQIEGGTCDQRTDIYAVGLILREMAGKRGVPSLPPALAHAIERCLARDPEERWQSALDLKAELEWSGRTPAATVTKPASPSRRFAFYPVAAIVAALVALAGFQWGQSRPRSEKVTRLAIALPEGGSPSDPGNLAGPPAISPNGEMVAMPLGAGENQSLWTRRFDSERFERVPGTEGAKQPFWSPDGKQLAFFADDKLRKTAVPGGPVETICDVPTREVRGGAWGSTGIIIFGVNLSGLMRVSSQGGEPVQIAGLDRSIGENSLRFPQFLSDGKRFIYFSRAEPSKNRAIYLDSLDTIGKKPRIRIARTDGPSSVARDPTGDRDLLLFPSEGHLWAQPFDQAKGKLDGQKIPLADDPGEFSVSGTGTLVLRGSREPELTWINRSGKSLTKAGTRGDYWDLKLSPDERQVALLNHKSSDGSFWVEILDLARNLSTIFSDKEAKSYGPTWSRDGRQLYFTSVGSGDDHRFHFLRKPIDAAGLGQSLAAYPERYVPHDLSPDGATLVGDREVLKGLRQTGSALVTAPLTSLVWTERLPVSPVNSLAQFSPDGKWLAYQSMISGRSEVYVTDYPGLTRNRQISLAGGAQPRWSAGSKELFYVAPDAALWSAGTLTSPNSAMHPVKLFPSPITNASTYFQYDVASDGQRFLIVNPKPEGEAQYIHVVIGWPELVRQAQGR